MLTLETAFAELEKKQYGIPYDAIDYLYNHAPCPEISDRIKFFLENHSNKNLVYDTKSGVWGHAPFWYSIVAENHFDAELVVLLAKIFDKTRADSYLTEQTMYLVGKSCADLGEKMVDKWLEAVEEYITHKDYPYYLLLDFMYFIQDWDKYKHRICHLVEMSPSKDMSILADIISDVHLVEAAPILEKRLKASRFSFFDSDRKEVKHALDMLLGKAEFCEHSYCYQERPKNWKEYLKQEEQKFAAPLVAQEVGGH